MGEGIEMSKQRDIPVYQARSFDDLPHTLVLQEVAILCSITYQGAYRWVISGQLKARKAQGTWLIEKSSLLTFVNKRSIRLSFLNIERAF